MYAIVYTDLDEGPVFVGTLTETVLAGQPLVEIACPASLDAPARTVLIAAARVSTIRVLSSAEQVAVLATYLAACGDLDDLEAELMCHVRGRRCKARQPQHPAGRNQPQIGVDGKIIMTRPEPDGCLVAELLDELLATLADWAAAAAPVDDAQDAGADDDSAFSDVAPKMAQQGLTPVELAVYGKPQPYLGRIDAAAFAEARPGDRVKLALAATGQWLYLPFVNIASCECLTPLDYAHRCARQQAGAAQKG